MLKSSTSLKPEGNRSITLLITDYKILARILAHRLRAVLEEHLRTSKFCSVPGNSIVEAVSTVREAVAQAEKTDPILCVVTLDFQRNFDRLRHQYLLTILESYGTNPWFTERIKDLYENTTTSVQVNGHQAGPIPIRCAIRQGCPLSLLLYALCLHPYYECWRTTCLGSKQGIEREEQRLWRTLIT